MLAGAASAGRPAGESGDVNCGFRIADFGFDIAGWESGFLGTVYGPPGFRHLNTLRPPCTAKPPSLHGYGDAAAPQGKPRLRLLGAALAGRGQAKKCQTKPILAVGRSMRKTRSAKQLRAASCLYAGRREGENEPNIGFEPRDRAEEFFCQTKPILAVGRLMRKARADKQLRTASCL